MKAMCADFEEFWTPEENSACPHTHTHTHTHTYTHTHAHTDYPEHYTVTQGIISIIIIGIPTFFLHCLHLHGTCIAYPIADASKTYRPLYSLHASLRETFQCIL